MPERKHVQIEAGEDVSSVKDRLSFMRGQQVLLIWPEEGTALTRKLDLVLIQREAMRRAIQLAIVTHDTTVLHNARELNISTFETINASERAHWKRGRSRVFTNRLHRPKDEPDHEDLQPLASRVRIQRRTLNKIQNFIVRSGVLGLLFGVVLAVAYVLIPGATVTLSPARQLVSADVLITVNTDPNYDEVDVENAVLPAIFLETNVEETATVNTTGQRELGDALAVGTVVFINQTGEEIEIPEGTIVSTSTGTPILFRTTQTVTLEPGDGRQIEAPIEAMPGSEGIVGNVAENLINTISGPLENSANVRNLVPTTGGQRRIANVVTALDRELVLGYARQQLQDRAYRGMLASPELTETQFLIIESLNIIEERDDWTQFSASVDAVADTVSVTMRATLQAVAVDEQIAQQIVFAKMAEQIPRGRVIQPETIEYQRGPVTVQGDQITFTLSGRGLVSGRVDEEQLKQQLAGRSITEALAYLLDRVDLAENTTPRIDLSPQWLNRMPMLPLRIDIQVQEPTS